MPPGNKATVDCILQFEAGVNIFVKVNRTLKSLGNHCDIYVIIQAHFSGCYVHLYSIFRHICDCLYNYAFVAESCSLQEKLVPYTVHWDSSSVLTRSVL